MLFVFLKKDMTKYTIDNFPVATDVVHSIHYCVTVDIQSKNVCLVRCESLVLTRHSNCDARLVVVKQIKHGRCHG